MPELLDQEAIEQFWKWEQASPSLRVSKRIIDLIGLKPAIVLSVFQDQKTKLDYSQISERLCFMSNKVLKHCLQKLLVSGYLVRSRLTESEIIEILKAKALILRNIGIGNLRCLYCEGLSLVLHTHHLTKVTVQICPTCHNEFHFLKRMTFYQLKEESNFNG